MDIRRTKQVTFDKVVRRDPSSYYFKVGRNGLNVAIKDCIKLDEAEGVLIVPARLVLTYHPFRKVPAGTIVIGDKKQARYRIASYLVPPKKRY